MLFCCVLIDEGLSVCLVLFFFWPHFVCWPVFVFFLVLALGSGVGTAPDLGNHFLLRQKVIKNRFLIPTAELPARLWRSGQTASVSQSFVGVGTSLCSCLFASFWVRSSSFARCLFGVGLFGVLLICGWTWLLLGLTP